MAVTDTTQANDVYLASQVTAQILDEIRPKNVGRQHFREQPLNQSTAYDFPIQDDPGAGSSKSEGTDMSNTTLTTSKATATAGTVGQRADVTDELRAISLLDALPHFQGVVTRSVLEKFETDLAAIYDDTTNKTTTSGIDATVATFLTTAAALTTRDIMGGKVFVGSPVQTTDLQQDLATNLAPWMGNQAAGAVSELAMTDAGAGAEFVLAGIPCYQTSTVPTANSSADVVGVVFVPNHSFGLGVTWDPRVGIQRDESNVLTEINVTARYGAVLIRANDAQQMVTDA